MAKFTYEKDGYEYEVEAPDEKAADALFKGGLARFNAGEAERSKQEYKAQKKQWGQQWENAKTPMESLNAGLTNIFGRANHELRNYLPGADTMEKEISPSLVKGIPIAGRYVPQTPELSQFERDNPKTAKGLNIAGGVGATLPLAGAMAMRTATGASPSFISDLMGQGTLNTSLNLGDKMAEKGKLNLSPEDAASAAKWGFGTGAVPAAWTKAFGQSARIQPGDELTMQREIARMLRAGIPRDQVEAMVASTPRSGPHVLAGPEHGAMEGMHPDMASALATAGGTAAGGYLGHNYGEGIVGALLGGSLSPTLQTLGRPAMPYLKAFAQHPTTQDILRAMGASSRPELFPNDAQTP